MTKEQNVIITQIKEIMSKYNIQNVYLFGSFSNNTYNKFSDIDLLVDCEDLNVYFDFIESVNEIYTIRKFDIHNLQYSDFIFDVKEIIKNAIKL